MTEYKLSLSPYAVVVVYVALLLLFLCCRCFVVVML